MRPRFIFFYVAVCDSNTTYHKYFLLPLGFTWYFGQKSVDCICDNLLSALDSVPLSYWSTLMPMSRYLLASQAVLKSASTSVLFQDCFHYSTFFAFPCRFYNQLISPFKKIVSGWRWHSHQICRSVRRKLTSYQISSVRVFCQTHWDRQRILTFLIAFYFLLIPCSHYEEF